MHKTRCVVYITGNAICGYALASLSWHLKERSIPNNKLYKGSEPCTGIRCGLEKSSTILLLEAKGHALNTEPQARHKTWRHFRLVHRVLKHEAEVTIMSRPDSLWSIRTMGCYGNLVQVPQKQPKQGRVRSSTSKPPAPRHGLVGYRSWQVLEKRIPSTFSSCVEDRSK